MLIYLYSVVVSNLLELFHPSLEFLKVLKLGKPQFVRLLNLLLHVYNLFLKECESLGGVVDLCRLLVVLSTLKPSVMVGTLPEDTIHALLSTHLLDMQLLEELLVLFDFLLRCLYAHFEIKKEIGRLHFFEPLPNSLVLLDEVLDRFVCIFDFLLSCLDLLGSRTVSL